MPIPTLGLPCHVTPPPPLFYLDSGRDLCVNVNIVAGEIRVAVWNCCTRSAQTLFPPVCQCYWTFISAKEHFSGREWLFTLPIESICIGNWIFFFFFFFFFYGFIYGEGLILKYSRKLFIENESYSRKLGQQTIWLK